MGLGRGARGQGQDGGAAGRHRRRWDDVRGRSLTGRGRVVTGTLHTQRACTCTTGASRSLCSPCYGAVFGLAAGLAGQGPIPSTEPKVRGSNPLGRVSETALESQILGRATAARHRRVGTGGNKTGASPGLAGGSRPTGPPVVWSTVSEPVALSPRRQHDEQKRRPLAGEPSVRAAMSCRSARGVDRHPTQRIMIPADFGLAIGVLRRGTEGARRHGHAASAAGRDRAGGSRPHDRPPVHRRLRRLLQAREPVARAHPRVSKAGALLAVGARHHPSARRAAIARGAGAEPTEGHDLVGFDRASAAPERFGEFRARCRGRACRPGGQAERAVCARAAEGTATILHGARDPKHNNAAVLAELLKRSLTDGPPATYEVASTPAGSRGSRAARGRSRRTT